jgi:hypothetical protein
MPYRGVLNGNTFAVELHAGSNNGDSVAMIQIRKPGIIADRQEIWAPPGQGSMVTINPPPNASLVVVDVVMPVGGLCLLRVTQAPLVLDTDLIGDGHVVYRFAPP